MYYRDLNTYLQQRFGGKVYKLALDGGFSCPNRDGTCGSHGCIFCDGAGAFAQDTETSVALQLQKAKTRVAAKVKDGRYIAYFQSFTNTYGPVSRLRQLFCEAMAPEDVVALSIATRPDCLPTEVLELLEELNRQKPVWVELGLQTIHPETARYIRRGYDLPVFDEAVRDLKARGLEVIVHMILGLPGETPEQMVQTARYIGSCGADGIKLHLLHVLQNTDLAQEYAAGRVPVLSMESYIALLEQCLQVLPADMVIHRLTGDGAKRDLIAPGWSADKKKVLNAITKAFRAHDLVQGSSQ